MEIFKKNFKEETDGFSGFYEGFKVSTATNDLKDFLNLHIDDNSFLSNKIKNLSEEILIIKNLKIKREFQGKGNGSLILSELLKLSNAKSAILICDVTENQLFGFILEKFYESHNFKAIDYYQYYPIMVYPKIIAEKLILIS